MGEYMCAQWRLGNNAGVIAWGNGVYYDRINAYDTSYEGVSLQDFVETDALINLEACAKVLAET